jgi:Malectin domain
MNSVDEKPQSSTHSANMPPASGSLCSFILAGALVIAWPLLAAPTSIEARSFAAKENGTLGESSRLVDAATFNSQLSRSLQASVVTPTPAPGFQSVLINCGGLAFTDSQNRKWSADKFFVGGSVSGTKLDIAGTIDEQLYNSERYNETTYSIPAPTGTYRVILHLCEI